MIKAKILNIFEFTRDGNAPYIGGGDFGQVGDNSGYKNDENRGKKSVERDEKLK